MGAVGYEAIKEECLRKDKEKEQVCVIVVLVYVHVFTTCVRVCVGVGVNFHAFKYIVCVVLKHIYNTRMHTQHGFCLIQPSMGGKLMKLTSALGKKSRVDDLSHTYHFVQMRGPDGKGFAEMAVSRVEAAAAGLYKGMEHSGGGASAGVCVCGGVEHSGGGASAGVCVEGWSIVEVVPVQVCVWRGGV